MYFQNFLFWLVFVLYWCDGTCNEPQQFKYDDSKYTTENKDNIRSVLSETIAQAVQESKFLEIKFITIHNTNCRCT